MMSGAAALPAGHYLPEEVPELVCRGVGALFQCLARPRRRPHRIAVVAGDGIGKEVVPEGQRVVEAAGRKFGFSLEWDEKPWSCEYYAKHGEMMPKDGSTRSAARRDLPRARWLPGVPDHVSLWGLLIPIRRNFQLYVNLRPVRLMPGVKCPLADRKPGDIDFWVVRENNEGEYSNAGGTHVRGHRARDGDQLSIFTRHGTDRIMRFAFELAKTRKKKHVTSATKSNGISITMPFWDERFKAISAEYPDVKTSQYHIDILTAHFVQHPDWFDVVVGSNLFGDILSDLGPACTGTIGIAPSANLNPEREFPSCFEPVHGSAPDIYGKGIANPIGQIWSGAMMLEHLGHKDAGDAIVKAIETVLKEGPRTRDMGGQAGTIDVGKAIAEAL
jgi:tartrate dehydrogenase/decarboxylase/D-malate dehydrogenase